MRSVILGESPQVTSSEQTLVCDNLELETLVLWFYIMKGRSQH